MRTGSVRIVAYDQEMSFPEELELADPTGRVLRLLSLLQTHRRWSSDELAGELGVTARTVRRDIDRLRLLGYDVDAVPGREGGYRLAAGSHLPPLMFDDDEAVAIAVGLWSATAAPLEGIEETALRALAKIEALLPDRVRRRTQAITTNMTAYRWYGDEASIDIESVTVLTDTCRDAEQLRFDYTDKEGQPTRRLVEPHHLVAVDERWYLLAWDVRRDDWRTFRLDRLAEPRRAGVRFERRPIPDGDPAAFVAKNLGRVPQPFEVELQLTVGTDELLSEMHWLEDRVTVRGDTKTRIVVRGRTTSQLAAQVARLAVRFEARVVGTSTAADDVRGQLVDLSDRLASI